MIMSTKPEITEKSGYLWVVLPDSVTPELNENLEAEIENRICSRVPNVVIDLSRTINLYSSGLGLLIRIRKLVTEKDGVVCLINVSRRVRDLLSTMNLDKIFPIFATDVEFEVSDERMWHRMMSERELGLVFGAQLELGIYRITISGQLTESNDISSCKQFMPSESIKSYIFDMTGLTLIDSSSIIVFQQMLERIASLGGAMFAFGIDEHIRELLELFDMDKYMKFFDDERMAIRAALSGNNQ